MFMRSWQSAWVRRGWYHVARMRRVPGQALPMGVLCISLLVVMGFAFVSIADKYAQHADLESALGSALRSGVQSFDYAAFARDDVGLRDPAAVKAVIMTHLAANLQNVRGLRDTPAKVARSATITVLPTGGTCGGQTTTRPIICGQLRAYVADLAHANDGQWMTVTAVVDLDQSQ